MQRENNDCGITCLISIMKYFGFNINRTNLSKELNVSDSGVDLHTLINFLAQAEANPVLYRKKNTYNKNKIILIDKYKLPFIVFKNNNDGTNHYMIVYRIKNNKAIVSDPCKPTLQSIKINNIFNNVQYIIVLSAPKKICNTLLQDEYITNKKIINILMRKSKFKLLSILVETMILMFLSLIVTSYVGILTDNIYINNKSILNIIPVLILFIIIVIIKCIIEYFKNNKVIDISYEIEKSIYNHFIENMLSGSGSIHRVGDRLSRLNDSLAIIRIISNTLISILINIFMILGSIPLILYMSKDLFFIIILVSAIFLLISWTNYNKLNQKSIHTLNYGTEYYNMLTNVLTASNNIKAISEQAYHHKRLDKEMKKYIKAKRDLIKTNNLKQVFVDLVYGVSNLLLISYGMRLVMAEMMSLGRLYFFISVLSLFMNSILSMTLVQSDIQNFFVAYNRLIALFEEEPSTEKRRLESVTSVKVKDYHLIRNKKIVLQDINIDLFNNYIIVGESGCGKTSLVKSIVGFEQIFKGKVLINDIELSNYNIDDVRKKIIYVSNKEIVMNGTILENLCFDRQILKTRLLKVCDELQILDYIYSLPDGFNHKIYDNGKNLSLGQIQRIAIARAILCNPNILILDEALSNIDSVNKNKIIDNLNHYSFKKIYITHDENIIKNKENYNVLLIQNKKIIRI